MALTRFQAGRPHLKERQAGADADGPLFPLTTAAVRRNPGLCQIPLLTGDQQPGAGGTTLCGRRFKGRVLP